MKSFFNKLYKYKQSDQRHQKENFLTEIFAYCLTNDMLFRQSFLSLINNKERIEKFICVTQLPNNDFGKPDVFIEINENTIIIIECKVGSSQEETQLKRYSKILLKHNADNKHLIFLTKYFEETETFELPINFFTIRWYEVSELLINCKNEVSKELYNYLKEEKMSTKVSFNKSELSAIKNIQETYAKMNEFIMLVKDRMDIYVKSKINLPKKIESGFYGVYTDFYNGTLSLGFCQYEDDEETKICISIDDVPFSNNNFDELDKKLKSLDWEFYDNDNEDKRTWLKGSYFSSFFIQDSFAANKALSFLEVEIQNIKQYL